MENQNAHAHHKAHNDGYNSPHDRAQYHSSSLPGNPNLSQMDVVSDEVVNMQTLALASIRHTSSAPFFFFPSLFSTS